MLPWMHRHRGVQQVDRRHRGKRRPLLRRQACNLPAMPPRRRPIRHRRHRHRPRFACGCRHRVPHPPSPFSPATRQRRAPTWKAFATDAHRGVRGGIEGWLDMPPSRCRRYGLPLPGRTQQQAERGHARGRGGLRRQMQASRRRHRHAAAIGHHRRNPPVADRLLDHPCERLEFRGVCTATPRCRRAGGNRREPRRLQQPQIGSLPRGGHRLHSPAAVVAPHAGTITRSQERRRLKIPPKAAHERTRMRMHAFADPQDAPDRTPRRVRIALPKQSPQQMDRHSDRRKPPGTTASAPRKTFAFADRRKPFVDAGKRQAATESRIDLRPPSGKARCGRLRLRSAIAFGDSPPLPACRCRGGAALTFHGRRLELRRHRRRCGVRRSGPMFPGWHRWAIASIRPRLGGVPHLLRPGGKTPSDPVEIRPRFDRFDRRLQSRANTRPLCRLRCCGIRGIVAVLRQMVGMHWGNTTPEERPETRRSRTHWTRLRRHCPICSGFVRVSPRRIRSRHLCRILCSMRQHRPQGVIQGHAPQAFAIIAACLQRGSAARRFRRHRRDASSRPREHPRRLDMVDAPDLKSLVPCKAKPRAEAIGPRAGRKEEWETGKKGVFRLPCG